MEVRDILVSALRAVDEAGINGELRQVAFAKAVDLLAINTEPTRAPQSVHSQPAGASAAPSVDNPLDRIAVKLKLDGETVRHVYDIDGEEFHVVVGAGKLNKRASTGTKQLALLVTAGRQGAGFEEWTPVEEIRRWAEHYKRLDSANFASALKEMENDFTFRGNARKRELRLSRPGWENAAALVRQLGNGGES